MMLNEASKEKAGRERAKRERAGREKLKRKAGSRKKIISKNVLCSKKHLNSGQDILL